MQTPLTVEIFLKKRNIMLQADIDRLNGQLSNEKYVNNAPAELVAKSREQLAEQEAKISELVGQRKKIVTL